MSVQFLRDFTAVRNPEAARPVVILDEAVNALPFHRIQCPDLKDIGAMWLALPREHGEPLPRWATFSPAMIAPLLSKVCILRVGDWREDDIKFSLYGGHATARIGNGQPLVLSALKDDPKRCGNYHDICTRAGRSVDDAAPQYARKTLSWDGFEEVAYEVLMLPFMPENGISRVMQPITSQERPH